MPTEPKPVDFEVLPPESPREKQKLSRTLAWILDDLIPIPGTNYRIGLDPIIGLIPGVGDSSTAAFSSVILINALRAGVPRIVLVRMALNVLLNTLFGAVPVLGDFFSAWFKSNQRNYTLLQKHSGSGRKSTRADWIIVGSLLAGILTIAITISLAVAWLAIRMVTMLTSV